jgi:hypothetical protein
MLGFDRERGCGAVFNSKSKFSPVETDIPFIPLIATVLIRFQLPVLHRMISESHTPVGPLLVTVLSVSVPASSEHDVASPSAVHPTSRFVMPRWVYTCQTRHP